MPSSDDKDARDEYEYRFKYPRYRDAAPGERFTLSYGYSFYWPVDQNEPIYQNPAHRLRDSIARAERKKGFK